MRLSHLVRAAPWLVLATLALVLAPDSRADLTTSEIPFAPHGDSPGQSTGAPVELSPTAFIVAANGQDQMGGTADDVVLLVRHLNTTPTVEALPTPYLATRARPARLSASRSLTIGAGPDGTWLTADDVVYLLSQVGSEPPATGLTVGGLDDSGAHAPQTLAADRAILAATGPDHQIGTADDEIVLLTRLGDENTITHLPAPFLEDGGVTRPEVLTPHRILIASAGPDGEKQTADDLTYFFEDLGGANTRVDLPTPYLFRRAAPGRAVRVSGSQAIVAAVGEDGDRTTDDDVIYMLGDLGGSNAVTSLNIPCILGFGAGRPLPLTEFRTVVATAGPDAKENTADDELVVIEETTTGIVVTNVRVGGLSYDAVSRPQRLSASSCAVSTGGADAQMYGVDDEVVILTGAGGINAVARVPVPGLALWASSTVVPLGANSLAVSSGGPDGMFGTGDDMVAFVTGIDTGYSMAAVPIGEAFDPDAPYAHVLQPLGSQRAVLVTPGADKQLGTGGDDRMLVFEGIPSGFGFQVERVLARFKQGRPDKPARFQARMRLMLQEEQRFAAGAITFSMGDASQTIAGSAFRVNAKSVYRYRDKKGEHGFLRKVQWSARTGKLTLVGKGVGSNIETSDPDCCAMTLLGADWSCGQTVVGAPRRNGFRYKAPK